MSRNTFSPFLDYNLLSFPGNFNQGNLLTVCLYTDHKKVGKILPFPYWPCLFYVEQPNKNGITHQCSKTNLSHNTQ